jgi:hypothetical protein
VIARKSEYRKTWSEPRDLQARLERLQREHPIGGKGFTKAGVRKSIARLDEELAVFDGSAEARSSPSEEGCTINPSAAAAELLLQVRHDGDASERELESLAMQHERLLGPARCGGRPYVRGHRSCALTLRSLDQGRLLAPPEGEPRLPTLMAVQASGSSVPARRVATGRV